MESCSPPYVPAETQKFAIPQPQQVVTMSSTKNADVKSGGVTMRTVCVTIGDVFVRALCDTGATFTLMASHLAPLGFLKE